ncbi:undecaprenyl-diphosphate phosphatase [bacterium]|nr:undecaprenyl-diphosphate phosphatase [bacterium]
MFENIIEVLILSAIQGISEFLPISSSAHLILVSSLYEFKSSSLLIDISLHLGSLFAIIYFFRKELLDIKNNQRLLSLIIFGSIPLIIVGYILYTTGIIYSLRNIKVIAWATLIFGVILYIADQSRIDKKISSNLNIKTILIIGLFQIFSLIPGVSRAGITITVARILKFNRVDSSKISFLLSIPALAGASFLYGLFTIFGHIFATSLSSIHKRCKCCFFYCFLCTFSPVIIIFHVLSKSSLEYLALHWSLCVWCVFIE